VKKYLIKTFGCAANVADSEKIAAYYESEGYQSTKSIEEADIVIINSCSVRESAENRVFGLINNLGKLKVKSEKLKIVVTGCMLRYGIPALQKKLPVVNEFKKISEFINHQPLAINHKQSLPLRGKSSFSGLVPIMEGCNNFCTYCVVPYARGREKSIPFEDIVCEVEKMVVNGTKEITLLGQNVNSYGKDLGGSQTSFAGLLGRLHEIHGLEKISFLTSNPWDLTDDIIEAMKLPKIDRHLHLPMQSGDSEILLKMNRHYTAEQYLSLTNKIKKEIPEITIGTDIIVGFPGETEEQFQNTVELAKKVGFVKAYVAIYSPRPQTAAFKLKDDVPHKEKKRRWQLLDKIINKYE
jgi:tRNA-2-methylthio-N6-dimethylallyladenosine synthase